MPTKNDFKRVQQELLLNIDAIILVSPNALERKEALGDLCFSEGVDVFSNIISLYKELKLVDISRIPFRKLENIKRVSDDTLKLFNDISYFSLTTATRDIRQERDQLLDRTYQVYNDCFESISPVLSLLLMQNTKVAEMEKQSKELLEGMESTLNEIINANKGKEIEANQILDSMRKASAEAGVSQHAIYFKQEAEDNNRHASKWLKYTIIMASSTVVFAIVATGLFFLWSKGLKVEESIQLAVAKVLIFSILYYATVWCGRNYKAYLHNYIINKHRQNGLSTFQEFVKATNDEAIKNAVLLRSTETIFGITNSGFIQGESDQTSNPQILEIIRSGMQSQTNK